MHFSALLTEKGEFIDNRYTEDFMADLAYASMALWDKLEKDAGDNTLRLMTGLLNFGDPNYGAGGPEGRLSIMRARIFRLRHESELTFN